MNNTEPPRLKEWLLIAVLAVAAVLLSPAIVVAGTALYVAVLLAFGAALVRETAKALRARSRVPAGRG
jgi:hypothetical protein